MFKKLFLTSFLLFILICIIYPSKKENTKLLEYCYSIEKILLRNSIDIKKNASNKVITISKDIAEYGVSKTKGNLINEIINQYKKSKNYPLISVLPNEMYCLVGYWIEKAKPGTFESIFYEKTKKKINEFKDLKNEVDELLKDINIEYRTIKEEFNNFLNNK